MRARSPFYSTLASPLLLSWPPSQNDAKDISAERFVYKCQQRQQEQHLTKWIDDVVEPAQSCFYLWCQLCATDATTATITLAFPLPGSCTRLSELAAASLLALFVSPVPSWASAGMPDHPLELALEGIEEQLSGGLLLSLPRQQGPRGLAAMLSWWQTRQGAHQTASRKH